MIVFPKAQRIAVFEAEKPGESTFVAEFRQWVEQFPLPKVSKDKELVLLWEFVPAREVGEMAQPLLRSVTLQGTRAN